MIFSIWFLHLIIARPQFLFKKSFSNIDKEGVTEIVWFEFKCRSLWWDRQWTKGQPIHSLSFIIEWIKRKKKSGQIKINMTCYRWVHDEYWEKKKLRLKFLEELFFFFPVVSPWLKLSNSLLHLKLLLISWLQRNLSNQRTWRRNIAFVTQVVSSFKTRNPANQTLIMRRTEKDWRRRIEWEVKLWMEIGCNEMLT